jgi:lipopolysaccharide heptosyltransferase II
MSPRKPSIAIQRLQAVDRRLGWFACVLIQPWRWLRRFRRSSAMGPAEEILLIKFWGIGSLQLLTPAVEVLRRRHQGARITLLTLRENVEFAEGLDVFDAVRPFNTQASSWFDLTRRIVGLARSLRAASYDCVYDFEFFTRFSALVSFLTGAGRTTGFNSSSTWRGALHSDNITFNRYWHVARNFRALAGGETGDPVPVDELSAFQVSAGDEASLAELFEHTGVRSGPYVVLNPNAGRLSLERRWSRANFAELARKIQSNTDATVIVVGSKSEQEYTAELRNLTTDLDPTRLVDLAGQMSIGELAALLRGAAAVVSNDSGPMHLSAALGAPTLGLFGPETPLMYEPLGPKAEHLYRPTICSPCINVHQGKVATCIHSRPECLENITVGEVWSWLERSLGQGTAQSPAALRALDA